MARKSEKTTSEKKHSPVPPAVQEPAKTAVAKAPETKIPSAATPTAAVATVQAPVATAAKAAIATASTEVKAATHDAKCATHTENATVKAHIQALHDVDADVAREAATSLGQLACASAVDPLIVVVKNADGFFHSVVRSAAAVSLGQLKDARAVEPLLEAVNDPITDPSTEAIRASAAIGDRRAVGALIEVVRNNSGFFVTSVRRAAVLGLVKLGGEESLAELRKVAADDYEDAVIRDEAGAATRAK